MTPFDDVHFTLRFALLRRTHLIRAATAQDRELEASWAVAGILDELRLSRYEIVQQPVVRMAAGDLGLPDTFTGN